MYIGTAVDSVNGIEYINKTPAQALTPPAEKKIGTKWAFMYNCSIRQGKRKVAI